MTRLDHDSQRGPALRLVVDGRDIQAFAGETVATALLASGVRAFRTTSREEAPRALFCCMGVCFECLVTVDDRPNVRACVTAVAEGMRVVTGKA